MASTRKPSTTTIHARNKITMVSRLANTLVMPDNSPMRFNNGAPASTPT